MQLSRVDIVRAVCASATCAVLSILVACGRGGSGSDGGAAPAAAVAEPQPAAPGAPVETPAAAPAPEPTPVVAVATPSETPPAPAPTPAPEAAPATAPEQPAAKAVKLGPIHKLTVTGLDGQPVSLAQFAGRPMIIEIWATWCGPCRVNRNTIHKMKSEFPERLVVIGVSYDMAAGSGSTADLVKNFLKNNVANDHEFLATDEFREFVNQRATSNSIPKTMYVTSKGQVVDLSEGVQGPQWLRGMAKNLK